MLSYTRRGQTSSLVVVFGHLFHLPWAKTNKESCCSTFQARTDSLQSSQSQQAFVSLT